MAKRPRPRPTRASRTSRRAHVIPFSTRKMRWLACESRGWASPQWYGVVVDPGNVPTTEFGADAFALGVGALGGSFADCAPRFGEFLAVSGVAAFQPADGSSRPDFVVSQNALV